MELKLEGCDSLKAKTYYFDDDEVMIFALLYTSQVRQTGNLALPSLEVYSEQFL